MPKPRTTTFGTSTSPTKKPLDGYFKNNQWSCNCQPRLPAVQFQVQRDSPNKGRWFYTCQVDRTKGKPGDPARCSFFLWAEDARLREEAAVLNNSTTEPGGSTQLNGDKTKSSMRTPRKLVQTTLSARVEPREEGQRHWSHRTEITPIEELERTVGGSQKSGETQAQGQGRPGGTHSGGDGGGAAKGSASNGKTGASTTTNTLDHDYGSDMDTEDEDELSQITDSAIKSAAVAMRQEPVQTPSAGSKRKRDVGDLPSDDDDLFGDMDSDEERQLAAITDSSSQSNRSRNVFTTPAAQKTTIVTGMPTPSLTDKPVRRVLFVEPEKEQTSNDNNKRQRNDDAGAYTSAGSPTTPSSSQEGGGPSSSPAAPGSNIENMTQEVMGLLKDQNIDEQVLRQVKNTLETYATKAKGVEKGRDATRKALKQKEGSIAQLQMRVTDLENRRKLDLDERRRMRSGLMHLYTQT